MSMKLLMLRYREPSSLRQPFVIGGVLNQESPRRSLLDPSAELLPSVG